MQKGIKPEGIVYQTVPSSIITSPSIKKITNQLILLLNNIKKQEGKQQVKVKITPQDVCRIMIKQLI